MNMLRFCTLFATNETVVLVKDVGMIPQEMKRLGYIAEFASQIGPNTEDDFVKQTRGLIFRQISSSSHSHHLSLAYWPAIKFLLSNSKQIDILNLYFIKHSMIYGILYKLLNPQGILYVKADVNAVKLQNEGDSLRVRVRNKVFGFYLRNIVNCISAETVRACKHINQRMRVPFKSKNGKHVLIQILDGVDAQLLEEVKPRHFEDKSNMFLFVGRVGTEEKNCDLILEALSQLKWKSDWKMTFVGPTTDAFREKVNRLIQDMPHLSDRVELVGEVRNRVKLFEYFDKSKVFCLSSIYESFGIVIPEAMCYGNYVISTKVGIMNDLHRDSFSFDIAEDAVAYATAMQRIMDSEELQLSSYNLNIRNSRIFLWPNIASTLDTALKNIKSCQKF